MPKRNHKYPMGQIVRILKSPHIMEHFHAKYAYITSYVEHNYIATLGEPEYHIVVQGYPGGKCRVYQKEIQEVE